MSKTKEYLENLSYEMGFDGEINDHVLREAELRQFSWYPDKPASGLIQQKAELNQRLINRIVNIIETYDDNDDVDVYASFNWICEAVHEYHEAKDRLSRLLSTGRQKRDERP